MRVYYFLILFVFISIGFGCTSSTQIEEKKMDRHKVLPLENGFYKGGVLRINEPFTIPSLFPMTLKNISAFKVATQLYEGLVRINPYDLRLEPSIAKSWVQSKDGLVYVFHIRPGVFFHKNKPLMPLARALTARDVGNCLKKWSTDSTQNKMQAIFKEVVANGDLEALEAIKVLNDSLVQVRLKHPYSPFLALLTHPVFGIYPIEMNTLSAKEKAFTAIGTGPFLLEEIDPKRSAQLLPNMRYWKKDAQSHNIPYLGAIQVYFQQNSPAVFQQFREGKLDVLADISIDKIEEITYELSEAIEGKNLPIAVKVTPKLSSLNLFFNLQSPLFKLKEARMSVNRAIDRKAIAKYALLGDVKPVNEQVVPSFFMPEQPEDKEMLFSFDPGYSKQHWANVPFKHAQIYLVSTLSSAVGEKVENALVKMLKQHLGVSIRVIDQQESSTLDEQAPIVYLSFVQADFYDPVHYTSNVYAQAKKYSDNCLLLDSLQEYVQQAERSSGKDREEVLYALESYCIKQALFAPVCYTESTTAFHNRVENIHFNAIDYLDLSKTYVTF